jgi:tetratricopeptide (TPR) repeat protein
MNMPKITFFKRGAMILSVLLLAACAHAPQQITAAQPVSAVEAAPPVAAEQQEEEEAQPKLPNMGLNGQMLYDFLLGEIAAKRGDQELAMQLYMDLANTTQDPRVARRAAQFALDARQMDKSVEALSLWLKLEPTSHQARQMLVVVLLGGGKIEEARPYLEQMLAAYPSRVGHTFTEVYSLLMRSPDREAVYKLLADLTRPYPRVAEGHMALAQAAAAAGKREEAEKEVHQARILRPEWEMAAVFEAQLLQRESPQQALALLKDYLATYPDAGEMRLLYARMLLEQKQNSEARAQFQHLLDEHPESADLAYAVAMISLEMGELDRAESELRQALAKGKKDDGTVYYYLGRLDEAKQHDADALQNYRQVKSGDYAYDARLRVAYLLFKAGKLDEAREYLHQTAAVNNQQRVQLWLVEAELLRDAKQVEAALQVLKLGMEKLPNHPDLLYEAGMLEDQLGKHDEFEQMMRRVIEVNPEHAQAYNALGYSMLDRNEHIPEAMQLVEKAIQLAPDDAGIIDSVGWGYYREGNLDKSLEFLRRAFNTDPDPEIAAHLGEVLWVRGEKEQAKKIWDDALKLHPDNAALQAAMKKFMP